MAAVAGDAENINKQARNVRKDWLNSPARANWVKNKQEANGFLRSAPVRSGGCPRRLALRTPPPTLRVIM